MLSKNIKRLILIIIDLVFSGFIWHVNASWGNTFLTCLILSTTTFLIIYTPFEIYWSFRDLWFDRWNHLQTKELEKRTVKIYVSDGNIDAEIIKNKKIQEERKAKGFIIMNHGFSDTKEDLHYFSYALANYGYIVLSYDARGIGESNKMGHRTEFQKRIEDFQDILQWIINQRTYGKMKINCVAFSIGAVTALTAGFKKDSINKIVAISSISKYKALLKRINFFLLLLYSLKGVKIFPSEEENRLLSPYHIFKTVKDSLSAKEWNRFSNKVLLIHSRNDKVIDLQNFQENKEILDIPPKNQLIMKKGGHSQKKNELNLIAATIRFFED
ncbi:MAG: alpha/beta hydrolase family protein [Promethearchaeia archaeon]